MTIKELREELMEISPEQNNVRVKLLTYVLDDSGEELEYYEELREVDLVLDMSTVGGELLLK